MHVPRACTTAKCTWTASFRETDVAERASREYDFICAVRAKALTATERRAAARAAVEAERDTMDAIWDNEEEVGGESQTTDFFLESRSSQSEIPASKNFGSLWASN